MAFTEILIVITIGLVAGLVGGMFGVGGGVIIVPALVFFLGMSQHSAQGTSIAMMALPIGILAAFNYYKQGNVNVSFAVILAMSFITGAFLGSKFSLNLDDILLKRLFGILLLLVAMKLIFFPKS